MLAPFRTPSSAPSSSLGVLTFHRCINYGSYWQTRCLVEGLQARGHHVQVLDHRSRRVDWAEWRCALNPVLPLPTSAAERSAYARKTRALLQAVAALPLSRPFSLEDPVQMAPVDTVVVGSDEVWNLAHPWYGWCSLFYGEGLRARRRIAYAASFGNYSAERGLPAPWRGWLGNFDAIAVRDANAQALVTGALGTAPPVVLDPCLQFPHVGASALTGGGAAKPHVAVYGHNFSPGFAALLRAWADRRGLVLASIGYRNDWCDTQWLTAGPEDFARFMARADAVATNFFHGCVFALRHHRPFVCEESSYRAVKIRNLLALMEADDHLAGPGASSADIDARLSQAPSLAVEARLQVLRAASDAWLDEALDVAPEQAEGPRHAVA